MTECSQYPAINRAVSRYPAATICVVRSLRRNEDPQEKMRQWARVKRDEIAMRDKS